MRTKKTIFHLAVAIPLLAACATGSSPKDTPDSAEAVTLCSEWECIEANKNKQVTVKGVLRKYTPNKTGKGAGHMFWDWEVLLNDSHAIPAQAKSSDIDLSELENKRISASGIVFYGIVIGSDEPHAQNATGYRLDIDFIREE
jgi:hypothetical protein